MMTGTNMAATPNPQESVSTGEQQAQKVIPADELLSQARTELRKITLQPQLSEASMASRRGEIIEQTFPSPEVVLPLKAYPLAPVYLTAEVGTHPCQQTVVIEYSNSSKQDLEKNWARRLLNSIFPGKTPQVYHFKATVLSHAGAPQETLMNIAAAEHEPTRDTAVAEFLAGVVTDAKKTSLREIKEIRDGVGYGEVVSGEEQLLHDIGKHFGYPVKREILRRLTSGHLEQLEESYFQELSKLVAAERERLREQVARVAELVAQAENKDALKATTKASLDAALAEVADKVAEKERLLLGDLNKKKKQLVAEVAKLEARLAPYHIVDRDRVRIFCVLEDIFPDRPTRPPMNDSCRSELLKRIADTFQAPEYAGSRNVDAFLGLLVLLQRRSLEAQDGTSAKEANELVTAALEIFQSIKPVEDQLIPFFDQLRQAPLETLLTKIRSVLIEEPRKAKTARSEGR